MDKQLKKQTERCKHTDMKMKAYINLFRSTELCKEIRRLHADKW